MEYKKPDSEVNHVNEIATAYNVRRLGKLRIFNSFDEAADAEALDAAALTPEGRIRQTVELILRVYGVTRQQLIEKREKLKIKIISAEKLPLTV